MLKLAMLSVAVSLVTAETAYSATQTHKQANEFIFEPTDDAKIAYAR